MGGTRRLRSCGARSPRQRPLGSAPRRAQALGRKLGPGRCRSGDLGRGSRRAGAIDRRSTTPTPSRPSIVTADAWAGFHRTYECPDEPDARHATGGAGRRTHMDNPDLAAWRDAMRTFSPFTSSFNMSGQPAMSVPLALDTRTAFHSAWMFAAGFGEEATLFRLAGQLEAARPWRHRPPRRRPRRDRPGRDGKFAIPAQRPAALAPTNQRPWSEAMQVFVIRRLRRSCRRCSLPASSCSSSVRMIPGDVIDLMLGQNDVGADKMSREQSSAALGLDRPMVDQYLSWIGGSCFAGRPRPLAVAAHAGAGRDAAARCRSRSSSALLALIGRAGARDPDRHLFGDPAGHCWRLRRALVLDPDAGGAELLGRHHGGGVPVDLVGLVAGGEVTSVHARIRWPTSSR